MQANTMWKVLNGNECLFSMYSGQLLGRTCFSGSKLVTMFGLVYSCMHVILGISFFFCSTVVYVHVE